MSFYAESPFDPIVNVHWKKKKDDGGGGVPPDIVCDPDLFPCSGGGDVYDPSFDHVGGWSYWFHQVWGGKRWDGSRWVDVAESISLYPPNIPPYDYPGLTGYFFAQCMKAARIQHNGPSVDNGGTPLWIAAWYTAGVHPLDRYEDRTLKLWRAAEDPAGSNVYVVFGPRYTPTVISYNGSILIELSPPPATTYQVEASATPIRGATIQFALGSLLEPFPWLPEPFPPPPKEQPSLSQNQYDTAPPPRLVQPRLRRRPGVRVGPGTRDAPYIWTVSIECGG